MIRNMGISTITISSLLAGCLSSSILISGEFDRQTTLAILCKPITRAYYILGKYLGILAATVLIVFLQFTVLEIALLIKNFMDIPTYVTNATGLIDFICLFGIFFTLLQIIIITSISLVLSLYLNTIANITICFLFFIFCNTYSYVLPFHTYAYDSVSIVISIVYILFPDLQNLNMLILSENVTNQSSFWQGNHYIQYIVYIVIHSTTYCAIVVWLSIFLFKRKEIM